jgi:hypothetical protein
MATVTVNNIAYDLQNCSVELVTASGSLGLVNGIEELNYSHKVMREPMRQGRAIASWTDGEPEYEASITVQKAYWDYWVEAAQELGIGLAMMQLTIGATYFKENVLTQDTLWKCLYSSSEHAFKRGPDLLIVPVEFNVSNIYFQGVDVFGNDIGTAI